MEHRIITELMVRLKNLLTMQATTTTKIENHLKRIFVFKRVEYLKKKKKQMVNNFTLRWDDMEQKMPNNN